MRYSRGSGSLPFSRRARAKSRASVLDGGGLFLSLFSLERPTPPPRPPTHCCKRALNRNESMRGHAGYVKRVGKIDSTPIFVVVCACCESWRAAKKGAVVQRVRKWMLGAPLSLPPPLVHKSRCNAQSVGTHDNNNNTDASFFKASTSHTATTTQARSINLSRLPPHTPKKTSPPCRTLPPSVRQREGQLRLRRGALRHAVRACPRTIAPGVRRRAPNEPSARRKPHFPKGTERTPPQKKKNSPVPRPSSPPSPPEPRARAPTTTGIDLGTTYS